MKAIRLHIIHLFLYLLEVSVRVILRYEKLYREPVDRLKAIFSIQISLIPIVKSTRIDKALSKYKTFIVFLLLSVTSSQSVFGVPMVQEPEHIRQFDNDFKTRYSSRKYNYEGRKIVTQTPSGSGKYEDYKNGKPAQSDENNTDGYSINLGPFAWLFYLALAIAVIYLVYILLNEGGTGLFSSRQNRKLTHYEDITAENIENADIDTLILNAENDHDFRLAIRYYYLLVLKTLSLKNHIKFEDDKTNAEYLNEINEKPFSKKFAYTSYLYNYIWYGEFPLNNDEYSKAKSNFITLLNQVK